MYLPTRQVFFYVTLAGMTQEEKTAFKHSLKKYGEEVLKQRITLIQEKMDSAQQGANSEEKSSAGDKYETSRAMNHLEKDMHGRQLAENLKELSMLYEINTGKLYDKAVTGAVVQCAGIYFFIAAGLGKQVVNNQQIIFLSPHAPLAAVLQQKQPGEEWVFNKQTLVIEDIY